MPKLIKPLAHKRQRMLQAMRVAEQQRAAGPDRRMRKSLNVMLRAVDRELSVYERLVAAGKPEKLAITA